MTQNIDEILQQHGNDCPITIFRMARTRWQKAVAIEFLKQQKQITEMKNDLKWIKYLLSAMLSVTVIAVIAQVVGALF